MREPVRYLDKKKTDDDRYVQLVESLVTGSSKIILPEIIYIIKIDNWFGNRWLKFSNKVMGAFGISSDSLAVPPFIPNRVISENYYVQAEAEHFNDKIFKQPLHINQHSEQNEKRKISSLYPSTAFYWWSGNTNKNDQGSLMAYLPTKDGHLPWYIGFILNESWNICNIKGITQSEIKFYGNAA